jgi:hypothetical protein
MPKLIHFSTDPLPPRESLEDRSSQLHREAAGEKPWGLWFSPDDDWKKYSERRAVADDWCLKGLRYKTEVTIVADARVLRLENAAEIDDFTRAWAVNGGRAIRWVCFAAHWDGILIEPHCTERSNHEGTWWYKEWDVSSGCIWRPRAIGDLRPLNY